MHLDHDKFFDLLVENSGMTAEKTEKQLAELLAEMNAAFDENEAYEIDGFGIFSKLGNAVHFIPAVELETEINYKYAGMEPIKMPGSNKSESEYKENPIRGIMGETDGDVYEDPFEDAVIEKEEAKEESIDGAGLVPEEDVVEVPDELDDILSEFIGTEDDIEDDDPFAEVINETEEVASLDAESEVAGDDAEPKPEQEDINAHKQEDQESTFTNLVVDSKHDSDDDDEKPVVPEEDPFGESEPVADAEDDFIPILTNVSSGGRGKSKILSSKDEEPKAKPVVAPKDLRDRRQSSPAILYVILIILIIGIAGYASVYFGLINIDGITDNKNQIDQTTIPTQPEQSVISSTPTVATDETANRTQENEQKPEIEQPTQEHVAQISTTTNQGITTKPVFGLMGALNEAANTGYTIVLFSLTRETSAERERKKLENKGLRTIVKEVPSSKYGILYRVSVGQFRTMTSAAQAVEENKELFRENYFITKIN